MPSPFPGMDPYLEKPALWPDVHHGLISVLQATLNQQVRPRYYVRVEERVYISDENDLGRHVIVPDVRVAKSERPAARVGAVQAPPSTPGAAVAEPIELTTLIDDEIHEPRLEVIDGAQRQVVTVIEILSPTNKVPGSRGRESYEQKRVEVMRSPSHFVEIDLLRAGVPLRTRELIPPCDYTVHVSRVGRRPRATVWPIRLPQRLPVIPIPLRGDDPDAWVDLQQALVEAYDRGAYDLSVDYTGDPAPPLSPELAEWADALLREKGLR